MGLRRFGGPGMHGVGGVPLSSMGGGTKITYVSKVLGLGPSAYWPLWEVSGTAAECLTSSAMNGTYSSDVSGWPPGTGIGDGNTAPFFDGTNDYVRIFTAALTAAFTGAAQTIMIWARVANVGVWTDGSERTMQRMTVDANNYTYMRKPTTNNQIDWRVRAGGAGNVLSKAGMTETGWMHVAQTWTSNATYQAYYNGAAEGAPQAIGIWAGALADAMIGATNATPTFPWNGWLAHCAIWNRVLTSAEIAYLYAI